MALLLQLVHEQGLAAVVATHDPSLVGLADEVLDLRDGAVAAAPGQVSPPG
jgi:putative ABC transport system ATP-binding protein